MLNLVSPHPYASRNRALDSESGSKGESFNLTLQVNAPLVHPVAAFKRFSSMTNAMGLNLAESLTSPVLGLLSVLVMAQQLLQSASQY